MQNFFEKLLPFFEVVARLLGNGWRVNQLDDCQYRIKLTSPELKRYTITVREEKSRLVIHGFVESRQWHGHGHGVPYRHHGVQRGLPKIYGAKS